MVVDNSSPRPGPTGAWLFHRIRPPLPPVDVCLLGITHFRRRSRGSGCRPGGSHCWHTQRRVAGLCRAAGMLDRPRSLAPPPGRSPRRGSRYRLGCCAMAGCCPLDVGVSAGFHHIPLRKSAMMQRHRDSGATQSVRYGSSNSMCATLARHHLCHCGESRSSAARAWRPPPCAGGNPPCALRPSRPCSGRTKATSPLTG